MPKVGTAAVDDTMSILTTSVTGLKADQQNLTTTVTGLEQNQERMMIMMQQMQGTLQEIQGRLQTKKNPTPTDAPPTQITFPTERPPILNSPNIPHNPAPRQQENQSHHQQTPSVCLPRLDIPYFSGEGVEGWLFQIEHYFEVHQIPPEQKLMITTFYMSGEALGWYLWMKTTKQVETWETLAENLRLRFGPSTYWNPEVALNKLYQTASVSFYISEFEALSIRTPDLSANNLLNRFMTGLKEEVHNELVMANPVNLQEAMAMARIAKQKLTAYKGWINRNSALRNLNTAPGRQPERTQTTSPIIA